VAATMDNSSANEKKEQVCMYGERKVNLKETDSISIAWWNKQGSWFQRGWRIRNWSSIYIERGRRWSSDAVDRQRTSDIRMLNVDRVICSL